MFLLALETTGPHCSVAVIDETGATWRKHSQGTLNHLQYLIPLTDQLLGELKLQLNDVSAIAVSEGPGSFTGVRIGVSTARGLAQVLGCKLIPVSTLKSFAYRNPREKGLICPIFDARRNQIYGGAYRWVNGSVAEIVPGGAYLLNEYLDLIKGILADDRSMTLIFYGDGLGAYGEQVVQWGKALSANLSFAPEEERYQTAESVAKLALEEYNLGHLREYQTVFPNYMRQAEAQRKLEQKQAEVKHG